MILWWCSGQVGRQLHDCTSAGACSIVVVIYMVVHLCFSAVLIATAPSAPTIGSFSKRNIEMWHASLWRVHMAM